ncbi:MAG: heavy metal translocating P-type ATPase [Polyangiaceae bacterium]|nr:heavy metal translocating P-type ATPase [Polyangiaceae bacterium]
MDHEHDHADDAPRNDGHDGHLHAADKPPGRRAAETGGTAAQLDLVLVLPDESDEQGRFEALETLLEARRGIDDVHLRADGGALELCIHYRPEEVTLDQVVALARSAGAEVVARYLRKSLTVSGMDCAECAPSLEHALSRAKGVLSANVAYASERLVLEYDRNATSLRDLHRRARALGFELAEVAAGAGCGGHAHGGGAAELPLSLTAGVLLAAGYALAHLATVPASVSPAVYVAAMLAAGVFAVRDAFNSIRHLRFDIETLMVVAAIGAATLGAFFEGALLLVLFSLGHSLEHRAMQRARKAVEALGKLRPETARVNRDGDVVELAVGQVTRGDVVVIRPGDRVPLDGVIRTGQSTLDQAAITGESVPVAKGPGDPVFAGTINAEAALEVEVTKLAGESALSRVVELVSEAEAQKSPTQRFTQKLERRFVPIVLLLAPAFALFRIFVQGAEVKDGVLAAMSLLVAASPCALAIATPAAVLSAVARAARSGVLMKGGAHIESLGKVAAIAFDKTGTLTEGKPKLVAVAVAEGVDENELVATCAGAEALSAHPLAKAICEGAKERGIAPAPATGVQAVHGKGLRATVGNDLVEIGNAALFDGTEVPGPITADVRRMNEAGQTTMIVRRAGRFLGVIGVADTLRDDARDCLAKLATLGVTRTVMLSGDNERVAQAIARQVGIAEVRAPLMPEGKVDAIRELARQGGVAMVGDGVNDAPALASASVGIAMGGAGSDVALETADVVLMSDDLRRLPFAVGLARAATGVIRQNLMVALGVSALLVVATILGWVGIAHAVIIHEGSTVLVVFNGLRLLALRA